MGTIHRQYRLTEDTVEILKQMADASDIPVTNVVKIILERAIDEGISPRSHSPQSRHRLSVYVTEGQDEWIKQEAARLKLNPSEVVERVVQLVLHDDKVDLNLAIRKVHAGTDHQERMANSA